MRRSRRRGDSHTAIGVLLLDTAYGCARTTKHPHDPAEHDRARTCSHHRKTNARVGLVGSFDSAKATNQCSGRDATRDIIAASKAPPLADTPHRENRPTRSSGRVPKLSPTKKHASVPARKAGVSRTVSNPLSCVHASMSIHPDRKRWSITGAMIGRGVMAAPGFTGPRPRRSGRS